MEKRKRNMIWQYISVELVIAAIAWFTAQLIKTIISMVVNHTVNFNIAFGSGGMPSSHSATVCALTTAIGVNCGTGTPIFGLAFILSFIVMYDAIGVRRETGNQGKAINNMMEIFEDMGKPIPADKKFKELVGHTPLQVVLGALLGIAEGLLLANLLG